MKASYLFFFITLSVFAQTPKRIQVLPNPQSLEDFDHVFKGCPENSDCDQPMGLMLQKWKDAVTTVRDDKIPEIKKAQTMEVFRSKYGIPSEFYTNQKSQQGFKPVLYNSPCKNHNPKGEAQKVLKGIAFIKSMTAEKAVVFRDQNQIEVPTSEILIPQPVKAYYDSPIKYTLALGDQPLFIKNKSLYILKEEDSFYYMLKVSSDGEWKIENVNLAELSKWEDRRQNVKCPEDKERAPSVFQNEFCKTVWDTDLSKTVIVRMFEGCII